MQTHNIILLDITVVILLLSMLYFIKLKINKSLF